ncbi:hypothetical protein CDAR_422051 [Caerostris darwini]|uniref:Uncharacterized protein n=1 Tax=Caerostris darwini TaxID=1538125 RepID=A0AAV4WV52_9ARAC|nr:hypothetical protein CDAR_422051 [Caerostris darwini]
MPNESFGVCQETHVVFRFKVDSSRERPIHSEVSRVLEAIHSARCQKQGGAPSGKRFSISHDDKINNSRLKKEAEMILHC